MPDVIPFQDAINCTDDRVLLIGYGLSAHCFSYSSLLDSAKLEEGSTIKALTDLLDTRDFEVVVRALEDAAIVERAYVNNGHADRLGNDAREVRKALVNAINQAHPVHREDLTHQYESAAAFLRHFKKCLYSRASFKFIAAISLSMLLQHHDNGNCIEFSGGGPVTDVCAF